MLRRLTVTITTTVTLWLLCSSITLAATKKPKQPDQFLPNPLESTTPDPLLPRSPILLNPAERQKLETALDELDQQATAQLQAGDKEAAFDTWNRELRLRRYFGPLAEVQALSRVGEIAWSNSERQEVQYITQRLQKIHSSAKSQKTSDLQFLQALAQAYQQVRSPKLALSVYDQILAIVKMSGDAATEVETLQKIGEVNLSWFDYPSAAGTYDKLLKIALSQRDSQNEIVYLQQLTYIYEQSKQTEQSLNTRNQLAEIYLQQNNLTVLPALKLAIGSDYESLAKKNPNLLKNAFDNYQEAYTRGLQLEQYVRAGEALQKLIALYRSQGQIEEALQTSQILVQTEEKATNFYGLMNAYDQIGQMHLQRKDYKSAQAAFQKGLELAQQLKYNEEYFTKQLKQISDIGSK